MAEKRMFSQRIIDSDAFLDMPLSTQALYFHLNMRADDDGFVNNPKRIQRTVGASEDDLKLLIAKRFLLCFENGVIVIKHWRMHNTLRKDRYNPTQYQEQFAMLDVKNNSAYTEKKPDVDRLAPTWQPNGNQLETQYRIGKDSIGKDSIGEGREEEPPPCPSFASIDYESIKNLYNTLCPSLPPVKVISASTKEAIQSLSYEFDINQLNEVFEKAEASSFLKGNNERKWQASFDWLIKAENIAKVLNGNYDDKNTSSFSMKGFKARCEQMPVYKQSKTAAEDEGVKARAEALKQQLSTG